MISVIIPAFNEEAIIEANTRKVHQYLAERNLAHEIVVVSNGSTDKTNEIGCALSSVESWFRFVELPQRSVGRAFASGVEHARGELLVSMDADLATDLGFVEIAPQLLQYCDMVVGSKGLGRQRRALGRIAASQLYISCIQFFLGLTVSDYSMGAKAYRREAILPAVSHIDAWTGYVLDLCLFLNLRGKRIIQIGVECRDRRKSRFNLIHEGLYRYTHAVRCMLRSRDKQSWLYTV